MLVYKYSCQYFDAICLICTCHFKNNVIIKQNCSLLGLFIPYTVTFAPFLAWSYCEIILFCEIISMFSRTKNLIVNKNACDWCTQNLVHSWSLVPRNFFFLFRKLWYFLLANIKWCHQQEVDTGLIHRCKQLPGGPNMRGVKQETYSRNIGRQCLFASQNFSQVLWRSIHVLKLFTTLDLLSEGGMFEPFWIHVHVFGSELRFIV